MSVRLQPASTHSVNIYNTAWWKKNCSVLTDGRTDVTKLFIAFRNCFAKEPKARYSNHEFTTELHTGGTRCLNPLLGNI